RSGASILPFTTICGTPYLISMAETSRLLPASGTEDGALVSARARTGRMCPNPALTARATCRRNSRRFQFMSGGLDVPHARRTARTRVLQYTSRMTSPTSEVRAQPSAPFFPLSGTLLPFLLLVLSLLVSPRFLEHHISLEWRLGNIRGPAYVLQAFLVGAAAVSMLFRRGISARLAAIFPSRRKLVLALVTGTM